MSIDNYDTTTTTNDDNDDDDENDDYDMTINDNVISQNNNNNGNNDTVDFQAYFHNTSRTLNNLGVFLYEHAEYHSALDLFEHAHRSIDHMINTNYHGTKTSGDDETITSASSSSSSSINTYIKTLNVKIAEGYKQRHIIARSLPPTTAASSSSSSSREALLITNPLSSSLTKPTTEEATTTSYDDRIAEDDAIILFNMGLVYELTDSPQLALDHFQLAQSKIAPSNDNKSSSSSSSMVFQKSCTKVGQMHFELSCRNSVTTTTITYDEGLHKNNDTTASLSSLSITPQHPLSPSSSALSSSFPLSSTETTTTMTNDEQSQRNNDTTTTASLSSSTVLQSPPKNNNNNKVRRSSLRRRNDVDKKSKHLQQKLRFNLNNNDEKIFSIKPSQSAPLLSSSSFIMTKESSSRSSRSPPLLSKDWGRDIIMGRQQQHYYNIPKSSCSSNSSNVSNNNTSTSSSPSSDDDDNDEEDSVGGTLGDDNLIPHHHQQEQHHDVRLASLRRGSNERERHTSHCLPSFRYDGDGGDGDGDGRNEMARERRQKGGDDGSSRARSTATFFDKKGSSRSSSGGGHLNSYTKKINDHNDSRQITMERKSNNITSRGSGNDAKQSVLFSRRGLLRRVASRNPICDDDDDDDDNNNTQQGPQPRISMISNLSQIGDNDTKIMIKSDCGSSSSSSSNNSSEIIHDNTCRSIPTTTSVTTDSDNSYKSTPLQQQQQQQQQNQHNTNNNSNPRLTTSFLANHNSDRLHYHLIKLATSVTIPHNNNNNNKLTNVNNNNNVNSTIESTSHPSNNDKDTTTTTNNNCAFRQFALLSATPETIAYAASTSLEYTRQENSTAIKKFLDPFCLDNVTDCLLDYYPREDEKQSSSFDPNALSTFCFPHGVRLRLIPRLALLETTTTTDGKNKKNPSPAMRLGLVGTKANTYSSLTFTDECGNANVAVVVSVFEDVTHELPPGVMEKLKEKRRVRHAARVLCRWWRRVFSSRRDDDKKEVGNKKRTNSASRFLKKKSLKKGLSKLSKTIMMSEKSINSNDASETASTTTETSTHTETTTTTPHELKKMISEKVYETTHTMNELVKAGVKHTISGNSHDSILYDISHGDLKGVVAKTTGLHRHAHSHGDLRGVMEKPTGCQHRHAHSHGSDVASLVVPLTTTTTANTTNAEPTKRQKMLKRRVKMRNKTKKVKQGKAAYEAMMTADKLGDACFLERCYVLIGGLASEQALLFAGLLQLVEAEREEQILNLHRVNDVPSKNDINNNTNNNDNLSPPASQNQHKTDDQTMTNTTTSNRRRRHDFLKVMQRKLCLTSHQSSITYPPNRLHHLQTYRTNPPRVTINLPFRNNNNNNESTIPPTISLPLPLPQVPTEFGLSTLLLQTSPQDVLHSIKLLLIERPLLILGSNAIQVTSSSCALLELLQPFKWASTFMPIIPTTMLDFLSSPVPFVAGIVADDPAAIMEDETVIEAMRNGMGILNLEQGALFSDDDDDDDELYYSGWGWKARQTLEHYTRRLSRLEAPNDGKDGVGSSSSSVLRSFPDFIMRGLSPEESVTLHGATMAIREGVKSLLGVFDEALGVMCERNVARSSSSSSSSFVLQQQSSVNTGLSSSLVSETVDSVVDSLRAYLRFQEDIVNTQLFTQYVEERSQREIERWESLKGADAGKSIAVWVYERWKERKEAEKSTNKQQQQQNEQYTFLSGQS